MFSAEQIANVVNKTLEEKGSRKFTQSIELIVNFKDIDFSKSENRLNLDIVLPKGRGKHIPVVVFADGNVASEAKAAGVDVVITAAELPSYDKGKIKELAKSAEFFAQPQLMMAVGKNFGQLLGARGRVPKPLVGNIATVVKNARNTVHVRTRGKNLPTVHCAIGTEKMDVNDIVENAMAVLSAIVGRVGEHALNSVYVKLSMGKAHKVEGSD